MGSQTLFGRQTGPATLTNRFANGILINPVAIILGAIRANLVSTGTTTSDAATAAALGQYTTAVMFFGFASIFAAIVFAIARILGAFRTGGGGVQQTSDRQVLTLAMPPTAKAKAMVVMMMMGMMMLLFAVVVHVILGINVNTAMLNGDGASVTTIKSWATWIEGVRRLGVAVYLVSISLGLATIVQVLRFQSARMLELP